MPKKSPRRPSSSIAQARISQLSDQDADQSELVRSSATDSQSRRRTNRFSTIEQEARDAEMDEERPPEDHIDLEETSDQGNEDQEDREPQRQRRDASSPTPTPSSASLKKKRMMTPASMPPPPETGKRRKGGSERSISAQDEQVSHEVVIDSARS